MLTCSRPERAEAQRGHEAYAHAVPTDWPAKIDQLLQRKYERAVPPRDIAWRRNTISRRSVECALFPGSDLAAARSCWAHVAPARMPLHIDKAKSPGAAGGVLVLLKWQLLARICVWPHKQQNKKRQGDVALAPCKESTTSQSGISIRHCLR